MLAADESEQMLYLEDQVAVGGQAMTGKECWKPRFNKALLLVVGFFGIASVATVWHFHVADMTATGATTALWDQYSSEGLKAYRKRISKENNNGDSADGYELVSWDEVMCQALKDNKQRIVRAVAARYPSTLRASCSSFGSPLEYAMDRNPDMVEVLLKSGAVVSDKIMVEAACHQHGGSTKLLTMFLRLGKGNPNAEYGGNSPINCAAKRCDNSDVEVLMRAGAFINNRDGQGFTPLLNALTEGCESLAEEFIRNGADIHVETPTGDNALQVACQRCMPNAAQDLLKKGIRVDHKDQLGRTALDSAAQHGCVQIASSLLNNPFTNVDEVDNSGQTALFTAVAGTAPASLVPMMIEKGADVNHQDLKGQTPLMIMAQHGKNCRVLLQHGADVAKVDKAGNTALWYAASVGSAFAATSLLEGGSESVINKKGAQGKTPFAIACWNTHPEVLQVLAQHGADPNIPEDHGQSPLSLATQFSMHLNPAAKPISTPQSVDTVDQWTARSQELLGVLKVLVAAKVNLNIYDFEGMTPLLNLLRFNKNQWGVPAQAQAFAQATQANANFLLQSGANPNMVSKPGYISPLAFCARNGYPSTASLLLQRGADRNARNAWGKTPAQLCGGGMGQLEVARMLR